jgi:glycosyltransferase involved in cell wall biosynthesis
MMTTEQPIMIDATTMYQWRDLAPVGIVRLERLLAAHVRFQAGLGPVEYVLWDGGYRPATDFERTRLDQVLADATALIDPKKPGDGHQETNDRSAKAADVPPRRRVKSRVRTLGLQAIARMPDHLRPFAEQAAWSTATLAVESARHVRRLRADRRVGMVPKASRREIVHTVDFTRGGDLIAFGLGWEYINHEAMYLLRQQHAIRIHMPAFDLIAMEMPQMNAGQSDLVHRYYADMAHYADSVTSISNATEAALRSFYARESLPVPFLATNQLPGFEPPGERADRSNRRRHRLEGERFVLTVSTIEIRKNHLLLAKLWVDYKRRGVDVPRLIVVGKMGWDANELFQWVAHAPELQEYVTLLNDVDDSELVEMYRDCEFTVFPSRVEGWGLPITEALTYGKVCVHADDPAQFEASQGIMPHFHPDDFFGWRDEIARLATDREHRAALETRIAEQFVLRTPLDYCKEFASILAGRREASS